MTIQLNSRIEGIAKRSLAFLRARGDLAAGKQDTYAGRRRTGDWLVKKSEMAPFFQRLGITKGQQIGHSFQTLHEEFFFKGVYFLYALVSYNKTYIYGEGTLHRIFHSTNFRTECVKITQDYYKMRKDLRREINEAAGLPGTSYYDCEVELNKIIKKGYTSYKAFRKDYFRCTSLVLYFLAAAYLGFAFDETFQQDLEDMRAVAEYELVHYGHLRKLLTNLHSIDLRDIYSGKTTVVQSCEFASNDMIEYLFGGSHAMWNNESQLWQEEILRTLDLMRCWEIIDTDYKPDEPSKDLEMEAEIFTRGAIATNNIDRRILRLASRLSERHGEVSISKEASGIHIYIPDPELLEKDGRKELNSKHLAINAERFLGIGEYDVDKHYTKVNRDLYVRYRLHNKEVPSARSMKTGKVYMVSDLLSYPPINERLDDMADFQPNIVLGSIRKRMVFDEFGNQIPEGPGTTVPLTSLSPTHPAITYLKERGFDIGSIERQFEASYCTEALPESRAEERFYRKLPGGFMNNAESRIIFNIRMHGIREGWQARIIDYWTTSENGDKNYFVWLNNAWQHIRTKRGDTIIWEAFPKNDRFKHGFDPSKYLNATGALRNKLLAGYDAAVEFNKDRPPEKRFCILVEGILDAAKLGPPAIAILGKSMSKDQAKEIRKEFSKVFVIPDTDKAGMEGLNSVIKAMSPVPVISVDLPNGFKDAGELDMDMAQEIIENDILPFI